MSVPENLWPEYAHAVWQEFTARTGKPERLMGAGEWWVLQGWLKRGIPLRIVLRGMADTKRGASNLAYYGPSVEEAYAMWSRLMSGAA